MMSDTTTLAAAAVLAAARGSRHEADLAEAAVLSQVAVWGRLHTVTEVDDAATWHAAGCGETGIPLGGEGVPLVGEFCVPELAAALGISTDAGRRLLAEALELAHRLPGVWSRVHGGDLPSWRARRIAAETLCLSEEAAAYVDQQVAPFAHRIGPAQTQRLVDEAVARFMPDFARERRERAADGRRFDIDHDQVSFSGTSAVHGELDLADALDLEAAVAEGAGQLARLGSDQSLDVRRAQAVGELARRQGSFDLAQEEQPERGSTRRVRPRRTVVLYVHLSEAAVRSHDGAAPGRLEHAGGQLVTAGQIADWCGADASRVTVKPVIDLAGHVPVGSYEVPDRLRERVALRDHTCVFPYCTRPARGCRPGGSREPGGHGCDADHRIPHARGGPTCPCNLVALCRRHHRLKTHGGWTYTRPEAGCYLWSSPYGYCYLRDYTGTRDLTPRPVHPPRAHRGQPEPPDQ
ncbi:MAG: DUF222 domain-containing protein [Marmoricola sp.]